MNLQKKNRSPFHNNKSESKIIEFINTINSLNYSIKEVYKDFTKNVETEYYFINLLESKIDKSDASIIEIINYLRIYKDLDKKSIDDFFEEAKIIFKKMKVHFNSLKQLINNNNNINHNNNINNILQHQKTLNNYNINNKNLRNYIQIKNNLRTITNNNSRSKSKSPFRTRTPNNSNVSLTTQDSLKIIKLKLSEKDIEIKDLKNKLKLSEQKNNNFFQEMKLTSKQKLEAENKLQEIKKKYEELQIKYSILEKNCYDFKSNDDGINSYEVEYDLKMMAKGAREKNYSQDMNIDNPAILAIKEKLREIIHKYNTLVDLVRNLILNVDKNYANENIINDIIKIIFGINIKR